eukprot:TRINITY_DN3289_c0_g1_i5.p1 TRINITY_DN3289_c0_g1~~TRINITY_DN3289_c0_g1_i5.p1  ORF type:complete len:2967 (+),score=969.15 TRINITY_DN3289_c0_g1_i5:556-8901(+)
METAELCAAALRDLLLGGSTPRSRCAAADGVFAMLAAGHAHTPAGEEASDAVAYAGLTPEAACKLVLDTSLVRRHAGLLLGATIARVALPALAMDAGEASRLARTATACAERWGAGDCPDAAACAAAAATCIGGLVSAGYTAAVCAALRSPAFAAAAGTAGAAGHDARCVLLAALLEDCPISDILSPADCAAIAAQAAQLRPGAKGDGGHGSDSVPGVAGRLCRCIAEALGSPAAAAAALPKLVAAGLWRDAAAMARIGGGELITAATVDAALAARATASAADLLAAAPAEVVTLQRLAALTAPGAPVTAALPAAVARLARRHMHARGTAGPLLRRVADAVAEATAREEAAERRKALAAQQQQDREVASPTTPSEDSYRAAEEGLIHALDAVCPDGLDLLGTTAEWQAVATEHVVPLLWSPWCAVGPRRAAAAACLRAGGADLSSSVLELAVRAPSAELRLALLQRAAPIAIQAGAGHRAKQAMLLLASDTERDIAERATTYLVQAEQAAHNAGSGDGGTSPRSEHTPVSPLPPLIGGGNSLAAPAEYDPQAAAPSAGESLLLRALLDRAVEDARGAAGHAELGLRLFRRLLPCPALRLREGEATELSKLLLGHLEGGSVRMRSAALAALEGLAVAAPAEATRLRESVLGRTEAGPALVRRACVALRAIIHSSGCAVMTVAEESALRERLVSALSAQPRATRLAAMRLLGKIGPARPDPEATAIGDSWHQMSITEPRHQGPVPAMEDGGDFFADLAAVASLTSVVSDPNWGRHHEGAAYTLRRVTARLNADCRGALALGALPGLLGIARDEGRKGSSRLWRPGVPALSLGTAADLLEATDRRDLGHSPRQALARLLAQRMEDGVAWQLWRFGGVLTRVALLRVARQAQRLLDGLGGPAAAAGLRWRHDLLVAAADLGTRPETEWEEEQEVEEDEAGDADRRTLRLLCLQLLAETGAELPLRSEASRLVHRLLAVLRDPALRSLHSSALGALLSVKGALEAAPDRDWFSSSPGRRGNNSERRPSLTTPSPVSFSSPLPDEALLFAPSWSRVFQPAAEEVLGRMSGEAPPLALRLLRQEGPPSPRSIDALCTLGIPQGRPPGPTRRSASRQQWRDIPDPSRVMELVRCVPVSESAAYQRWFDHLCRDLLRESPVTALYDCAGVGDSHIPLARDLFCVSFSYFQKRAHQLGMKDAAVLLEAVKCIVLRCDEVPKGVLAPMLDVAEFAERAFESARRFEWRAACGWGELSFFKLHRAAQCCDQDAKSLRHLGRSVGAIRRCTAHLAARREGGTPEPRAQGGNSITWWEQALDLHTADRDAGRCICRPELEHWKEAAQREMGGRELHGALVALFACSVVRLNHNVMVADDAKGVITQLAQANGTQLTAADCEDMRWWERALHLYDQQLAARGEMAAQDGELMLARCRCMDHIGDWARVVEAADWGPRGRRPRELASIVSRAALMLGDWSLLDDAVRALHAPGRHELLHGFTSGSAFNKVHSASVMRSLDSVDRLADDSPGASPVSRMGPPVVTLPSTAADVQTLKHRAILAVHSGDERGALRLAGLCMDAVDPKLRDCSDEGLSSRAYDLIETLQHIEELGELLEYRRAGAERRRVLQEMWGGRVNKMAPEVARLREAYAIRSLAGRGAVDANDFIQAARRLEKPAQGRDLLGVLLGASGSTDWVLSEAAAGSSPRLVAAYCWLMWEADAAKPSPAVDRAQLLSAVREFTTRVCADDAVAGPEKAECLLLQARAERERRSGHFFREPHRTALLDLLLQARSHAPESYQGWHDWAIMNYRVPQRDPEIHKLTVDGDSVATVYAERAVEGFAKSIELMDDTRLGVEDALRLLQILFQYAAHNDAVRRRVDSALSTLPISVWQHVMPQLVARVGAPAPVGPAVEALLERVALETPEPVLWPLVSTAASNPAGLAGEDSDRGEEDCGDPAARLLAKVHRTYPVLVEQVRLVASELVRAATLWIEAWHEFFRELRDDWARACAEGPERLLAVIARHEAELGRPATRKDAEFEELYRSSRKSRAGGGAFRGMLDTLIESLQEWQRAAVRQGEEAAKAAHEPAARRILLEISMDIERRLGNFTSLQLGECAPQLLAARSLAVCVPGAEREEDKVQIARFASQMTVLRSKQRPRKVSVHGTDGRLYVFLLKGNEDLRLDQRIMQLLRLVNTLRTNSGHRPSRGAGSAIVTYAVVPLSARAGLIGWVEQAKTLQSVLAEGTRFCPWGVGWSVYMPAKDKTRGEYERGTVVELRGDDAVVDFYPPPITRDGQAPRPGLGKRCVPRSELERRAHVLPPEATAVFHESLRAEGALQCSCTRLAGDVTRCLSDWRKYGDTQVNVVPLLLCWPSSLCTALRKARRSAPVDALARWMWMRAKGAEDWVQARATFSASLATMSVVGYVIGLGDRHCGNLLLRGDGTVVHIDFGDSFEAVAFRDQLPERVPFRLTPALESAMGVAGAAGLFRREAIRDMAVLRRGRDLLVALLEAFVHDPLVGPRITRSTRDLSGRLDRVRAKLEGLDMPQASPDVHRLLSRLRYDVLPSPQELARALSTLRTQQAKGAVQALGRWLPAVASTPLVPTDSTDVIESPIDGQARPTAEYVSPSMHPGSPGKYDTLQAVVGNNVTAAMTWATFDHWPPPAPAPHELRRALVKALGGLADPPSWDPPVVPQCPSQMPSPQRRLLAALSPWLGKDGQGAARPPALTLTHGHGAQPDSLTGGFQWGASLVSSPCIGGADQPREAEIPVTAAEQVDLLIQAATDDLNLARSYPPWGPWL